jgi:hypothetical protein
MLSLHLWKDGKQMNRENLTSWFFVVEPFQIFPNWKLAIMKHWCKRPQKYKAGMWTSYEFGFFRFYHWPEEKPVINID